MGKYRLYCHLAAVVMVATLGCAAGGAGASEGGAAEGPVLARNKHLNLSEDRSLHEVKEDLPWLTSLDDLMRMPEHEAGDGWIVKLGLADSGSDGGPWIYVYCLARFDRATRDELLERADGDRSLGDELGPVWVKVRHHKTLKPDPEEEKLLKQQRQQRVVPRGSLLFARAIPALERGYITLRFSKPDGKLLLEKRLRIDKPRPMVWTRLLKSSGEPRQAKIGHTVTATSDANPWPAMPKVYGDDPLLWIPEGNSSNQFEANGLSNLHASVQQRDRPPPTDLPGRLPLHPATLERYVGQTSTVHVAQQRSSNQRAWAVKIERPKVSKLTIHMKRGLDQDVVEKMLVRWWVNGEPVEFKMIEEKELQEAMELRTDLELLSVEVALRLPAAVRRVKPGSKVAMQVMVCPRGIERCLPLNHEVAGVEQLKEDSTQAWPMLSNRLEWVAGTPERPGKQQETETE